MRSSTFYFVTLVIVLMPALLFAQRHNIKTYSVSKGLPQAQVHDIEQTKDGYVWMATYGGGLVKFDGEEFQTFTEEDGLKSNTVEHVLVDSNDKIWISTADGGVMTFRGDSLVQPIQNDTLYNYDLTALTEFSDNRKWFGTYQGGIFIYDGKSVSRLTTQNGLASNETWDIFEDKKGRAWLGTSKGVSIYDGDTFEHYTVDDGLSGERVYDIIETDSGTKWIGTNNGITIWDSGKMTTIRQFKGQRLGKVFELLLASDGTIWIATEQNGVFAYRNGETEHFTENSGLSSNYGYSLMEDNHNNIWIGTDGDGVNIYRDQGFTFYEEKPGLSNNSVYSIFRDQENKLWMGIGNGLASFDGTAFEEYALPNKHERGHIWAITGLPNGDMLMGMPDNVIMQFDGISFTNFTERYDLENFFVYDFYLEENNTLWIASDNGLYQINLKTKDVRHFTTNDGLASNNVTHIIEDDKGIKWIGTEYGLSIFDGEKFENIRVRDGLADNQINYILQGPQGNIWLGTGGGVSVYKSGEDNSSHKIENFGQSEGMKLLTTHFIWFDEKGYLWQGTNGGLQMLDVPVYRQTGEMSVTHYPLSNTGLGREFNFHALSAVASDEIWMGSIEGLVQFNPNKKTRKLPAPELVISEVESNGVPVEWDQFTDSIRYHNGTAQIPSVTFPSGSNTYKITYKGLSYYNSGNINYRYKLEGFDEDWHLVETSNSATFTNLDAGDYTFIVQARNSNADWGSKEARYQFSIATPFWQTYWFYALMAFLFGGITYAFAQYRVSQWEKAELQRRVDKQTEHLTEALEEKEVLIKEIHHRVKNNLAVISGLLELQMDYADNTFVSRVLSESQRRVQSISMIHEKLYQNERLSEIDFEKYVRELIEVITYSFSNPDKEIQVNIDIDDFKLGIDQGIPCGLILNEVVSNAYDHAFIDRNTGTIDITISLTEDQKVRLIVKDDGKGLPEEQEKFGHESLGISLVETLGQQLEGKVNWNSNKKGTTFILQFEKEIPSVDLPTT